MATLTGTQTSTKQMKGLEAARSSIMTISGLRPPTATSSLDSGLSMLWRLPWTGPRRATFPHRSTESGVKKNTLLLDNNLYMNSDYYIAETTVKERRILRGWEAALEDRIRCTDGLWLMAGSAASWFGASSAWSAWSAWTASLTGSGRSPDRNRRSLITPAVTLIEHLLGFTSRKFLSY